MGSIWTGVLDKEPDGASAVDDEMWPINFYGIIRVSEHGSVICRATPVGLHQG
jgi:hypothetical protein